MRLLSPLLLSFFILYCTSKVKQEEKPIEPEQKAEAKPVVEEYKVPGIDEKTQDISAAAYLEANDEFAQIESRVREEEKLKIKANSEEQKVQKELDNLREAEKKALEEKAKKEKIEQEIQRKKKLSEEKSTARARLAAEKQAQENAKLLPGITSDELNWDGLE